MTGQIKCRKHNNKVSTVEAIWTGRQDANRGADVTGKSRGKVTYKLLMVGLIKRYWACGSK